MQLIWDTNLHLAPRSSRSSQSLFTKTHSADTRVRPVRDSKSVASSENRRLRLTTVSHFCGLIAELWLEFSSRVYGRGVGKLPSPSTLTLVPLLGATDHECVDLPSEIHHRRCTVGGRSTVLVVRFRAAFPSERCEIICDGLSENTRLCRCPIHSRIASRQVRRLGSPLF